MDKIDSLFVRACKSENPEKRLHSLYRRFWIGSIYPEILVKEREQVIATRLLAILLEVYPSKLVNLIHGIDPECGGYNIFCSTDSYYTKVYKEAARLIRYIPATNFIPKGFRVNAKYRLLMSEK